MDSAALLQFHFEQLKELRNGTISYIQIIKRDQVRPPVRPVCRKLGVTKLSEIKSETDLYEALTSVTSSQSLKSKDQENDDSESSKSAEALKSSRLSDTAEKFSSLSPDAVHAKVFQPQNVRPAQTATVPPLSVSTTNRFSANVTPNLTPRDSQVAPAIPFDTIPEFNSLLECVLHVRVAWNPWDRTQRLDVFAYQFDLDEKFLLNALKRICELLGCVHLSPEIEIESVVNAVKTYFRQVYQPKKPLSMGSVSQSFATANMTSDPTILSKFGMKTQNDMHDGQDAVPRLNTVGMQRDMFSNKSAFNNGRSAGGMTSIESPYTSPRVNENMTYMSAREMSNNNQGSINQININQGHNNIGIPSQMLNPNVKSFNSARESFSVDSSPRYVNEDMSARINSYSKQNQTVRDFTPNNSMNNLNNMYLYNQNMKPQPQIPQLGLNTAPNMMTSHGPQNTRNIFSIYETFWESSFTILRSIVNPDVKCLDTIGLISNLNMLISSSAHLSPALVAGLDAVLNKSFYELSSKVDKFAMDTNLSNRSTSSQSKDNLIVCIGALDELINNSSYEQIRSVTTFSSEVLLQNLIDQVNWCSPSSSRNDKIAEVDNNIMLSSNNDNWLQSVDQAFYQLKNELILPDGWMDVVEHIKFRLQSMLDVNHKGLSVVEHGAAVIGLGNTQSTDTDLIINLNETEQFEVECLNTRKDISRRISILENSLKQEIQTDTAIKYLQQCLIDQRYNVRECMKSNPTHMHNNGNADNLTRIKICSKLTTDSEMMCKVGDRFLEHAILEIQSMRTQPSLKALLDQLKTLRAQLEEVTESIEIIKTQTLLNLSCNLSQLGYGNVRIQKKFLESVITFTDNEVTVKPMNCTVVLNKPIYPYSSRLISTYFKSDSSEKIKFFAGFIKCFAKEHQLHTELSSYAWNIMIIHFLLRFGYIANIQTVESSTVSTRTKVNDVDVSFNEGMSVPQVYQEKLNRASVFELSTRFFKYFAFDGDTFGNVFTLRGKGDVIPKSGWSKFKPKVLWRFCLEDPFETGIGENPNDLGETLTFTGQAKIFKTMSMAYFALNGLTKMSNVNEGVMDILSKDKLYSLALMGGFSVNASFSLSFAPTLGNMGNNATISLMTENSFNYQKQSQQGFTKSNDLSDMMMSRVSNTRLDDMSLTPRPSLYNDISDRDSFSSNKGLYSSGLLTEEPSLRTSSFKNNFNAVIQPQNKSSNNLDVFDFSEDNHLLNSAPPGLFNQSLGSFGGFQVPSILEKKPVIDSFSSLNIHDDDANSIGSSRSGPAKFSW